ncbi:beta-ketoacyl synthase N-terminal-like domain-containing protein [Nocardia brasiliensis]|uniref:beta-ketoacyl synthase N-terminal-like domain-containing protein n=1 Tax=Nocardia brasiliensis TaxID=37326 RepID=UPI002458AFC4|nr:beta-ketoacyl synthase N-terminal-like domain-containing protein [Nocardia brasiliensis]
MPGKNAARDRVVIAGLGTVTGYGWGREALWQGLLSGKHAARPQPGFGPDRDTDGWVARIPDGGDPELGSVYVRSVQESVREAVADARTRGWRPGATVGLLHAIVLGDTDEWHDFYVHDHGKRRSRDFLRLLPSTPNSNLMSEHGFHGPAMNVTAACSSANAALMTAQMWLAHGFVDDVVVVASDLSAIPDIVQPFVTLGAAVTDEDPLMACRPFQEGSRGFGFGEAATAFVVTGAADRPYAAVLGGAMTNDGFHVISVEPSHEQIFACVRQALTAARVDPAQVAYLNSHGSGTQQCDVAETALLATIFDDRPQVLATKPLTGHCQAASGGVEVAATILGYEHGLMVSAPIVAAAHPRLVDGVIDHAGNGLTMKIALGMGGNNSALVLGPPD